MISVSQTQAKFEANPKRSRVRQLVSIKYIDQNTIFFLEDSRIFLMNQFQWPKGHFKFLCSFVLLLFFSFMYALVQADIILAWMYNLTQLVDFGKCCFCHLLSWLIKGCLSDGKQVPTWDGISKRLGGVGVWKTPRSSSWVRSHGRQKCYIWATAASQVFELSHFT